ncbi:hypothetical protein CI15_29845 [Paraburkholderia monticola]|uniref:Filamentous haemagglutinin FhaB/tRNA nuclease CdiA-like TPS domain-containing protein n=1 Tax=Paraburkholderia monticola TaxID=1399968 RepID=A0A149PE32_9BURK|nr:filamentous hemagglutinin N-terminal domain-containing protein [Paraburkholderia monticola]KXU83299.1 hypothetical protein CI15_29845 [Paraburkholderia monticola]
MNDTSCVPGRLRRRAEERARRKEARRARRDGSAARESFVRPLMPLVPLMILLVAPGAIALPVGGQVVNGSVAIGPSANNTLPITQTTGQAIVNWQSFSIGGNETVNIQQPNASAVMLNRVMGVGGSDIAGHLNANGKVFLVNTAGVVFSPGASVNVGSLVVSTLNIADADFLAGNYHFVGQTGALGGSIANQGSIQAGTGGIVAMLGGRVGNSGTVSAKLGTVALGAGSDITLDFAGDGLTVLKINSPAGRALVENTGTLSADGGQVLMSVQNAGDLATTVLNQEGVVRAQSIAERNGRIVLDGGSTGVTQVSGSVDATGGAGLAGGQIDVTGTNVALLSGALLDASGATGGGRVRFGGGPAGADGDIRNAQAIWMDPSAQMRADALVSGPGGQLAAYGTNTARIYGTLSALGGPQGGNGGTIDTSGNFLDVTNARINASAPMGVAGTWKVDPFDIQIVNATGPIDTSSTDMFIAATGPTQIAAGTIDSVLNQGGNVTISTLQSVASGTDAGNITLSAPIEKTTGSAPVTLTLQASGSIVMNSTANGIPSITDQPIGAQTPGPLNIVLQARGDQTQPSAGIDLTGFSSNQLLDLWTNGGNIEIGTPISAGQISPYVALTGVELDARRRTPGPATGNLDVLPISTASDTATSGSVTIQGVALTSPNSDHFAIRDGVSVLGSRIKTTNGAISITGSGPVVSDATEVLGDGVLVASTTLPPDPTTINSSIASMTGPITIQGTSATSTGATARPTNLVQGEGIAILDASITSSTGPMSLLGTSSSSKGTSTVPVGSVTGDAVIIEQATIQSTSGAITIQGSGATSTTRVQTLDTSGALIDGTTITSAAGPITVQGSAGAATGAVGQSFLGDGVDIGVESPVSITGTQVSIMGSAPSGNALGTGVAIFGPVTIAATQGSAQIFGSGNGYEGVSIRADSPGQVSVSAHNGIVDIRGVTTGVGVSGSSADQIQFYPGVLLDNARISATGTPSGVSITGSTPSTAPGFELIGTAVSTDPGGTVILRAASGSTNSSSISIDPTSSINAPGGVVVFAPASVETNFTVTPQDNVPITLFGPTTTAGLNIDPATYETIAPTLNTLVLGSSTQTGHITVEGTCAGNAATCAQPQRPTVLSNLTLENPGAGSQGDALPFGASMPGHTLTISSAGPVTDPNGIDAAGLLLAGNTSYTLTDPGNNVGRLAIVGAQDVTFTNPGSFDIGPLIAQTYDSATGTVTTIDGTNSSLSGSLLARSTIGGISLGIPGTPTSINAGRTIDLLAENSEFDNAGGGKLTAGNAWHIWEASWQGETRGGLDPGGTQPNFYGCVFPGTCSWGGSVTLGSNHFVYAAQPTLTVTISNGSRFFGAANPPFTFTVTGLINGDTASGAVLVGQLTTPANATSPVGQYPITGTFTSLVGYKVTEVPGTLTVTPLPLDNGQVFDRTGLQPLFTAQEQSFVYESNLGGIHVCVGSDQPILALQQPEGAADKLAVEWKRVRTRPNLNSCVIVNGQHGCDEF